MNLFKLFLTGLVSFGVLFACSSPILAPSQPGGNTLTLEWGPTKARTILPESYPSIATYDLTMKASGQTDVTQTGLTSTSISVKVVAAAWNVEVVGKDSSGKPLVRGVATLDSAKDSYATVVLNYISTGTGTGALALGIDWSSVNATYPVDSVTLSLTDPAGNRTTPALTITGTTAAYQLDPAVVGNYRAVFAVKSGSNTALVMESVLVLQNVTTSGSVDLTFSDFAIAPNNLSALTATLSGTDVNLSWTLPSTNQGDNVLIQRKLDSDPDTKYVTLTSTLSPTATTYSDTSGVTQGNGYVYRAALVNALNVGNPEWVTGGVFSSYGISTVAGNGSTGYSGNGGVAVLAAIGHPQDCAVDASGNVFIADQNGYVRKVSPTGMISTIAGNPGTADDIGQPMGVALDSSGNVYVTSMGYIRKVTPEGVVSIVAGNGHVGYSGDGGPATSASIGDVRDLAVDSSGDIYFGDNEYNRIRKITSTGIISTIAGNGSGGNSGEGGPAIQASFNGVAGIAIDAAGRIYFSTNYEVFEISTDGLISTVPGSDARLGLLYHIAIDPNGNLYVSDTGGYVRKATPTRSVSVVAGNGGSGFSGDNGPATSASIGKSFGVAVDPSGILYIADWNGYIRRVGPEIAATALSVTPTTLSLIEGGADSAPLTTAVTPSNATTKVTWSSDAPAVALVNANGVVTPVSAGTATITATTNGHSATCTVTVTGAVASPVFSPSAGTQSGAVTVTISTATPGASIRYTTDGNDPSETQGTLYNDGILITTSKTIKAIAYKTGLVSSPVVTATYGIPVTYSYSSSFAGVANTHGSFNTTLYGVALDSSGDVYVTDQGWCETFRYSSTGTYVGKWGGAGTAAGKFNSPMGIVVSGTKVYVGDYNRRIQQTNLDGTSPVLFGSSSDFGSKGVVALATDSSGRVYAFDGVAVTRWSSSGVKDTSFSITDSFRIGYLFSADMGIAVDSKGNVYIASVSGQGLILKYSSTGTYLSTVDSSYSWAPKGLAIDASDNLYAVICPSSSGAYVYVYNSEGAKVGTIGTGNSGTSNGDLVSPYGVAVSSDGTTVWVADAGSSNRRLTKFVRN